MWLLWACLVLVHPLGGPPPQPPSCPWEPFEGLVALMEALGDTNDGTLYTPDSLSVCPMEILHCFGVELSVIGHEEGPPLARAVNRLQRSLRVLGPRLWGIRGRAASQPCPPCEGYPERPALQFLAKLLELLQMMALPRSSPRRGTFFLPSAGMPLPVGLLQLPLPHPMPLDRLDTELAFKCLLNKWMNIKELLIYIAHPKDTGRLVQCFHRPGPCCHLSDPFCIPDLEGRCTFHT